MNQLITLFDLIIIIGIVQGLVTSSLLIYRNKQGDRFLAFSIVSFCLLSCKILLHTLGLWDTHFFRYFPLGIDLVIQPLIYLYVIQLIQPTSRLNKTTLLHFIPFAVYEIHALVVYFSVLSVTDSEAKDVIAESYHFNDVKYLEDYLTLLSTFAYLIIGLVKIKSYKSWLDSNISDSSYPTFSWLKAILIQLMVIGGLLLVNLSLDRILFPGSSNFLRWQVFYIAVALHIYYLGFMGLNNKIHNQLIPPTKKQIRKKVTDDQVREIVANLQGALEKERVYLNPKLSSTDLAKQLNIAVGNLSYAINLHYQKNFRELINEYRVKEAKSKLLDPSCNHLSILGIAYESGFSSEASFYRIFKKTAGCSPADYQKQHPHTV